jgi:hypothetical protein
MEVPFGHKPFYPFPLPSVSPETVPGTFLSRPSDFTVSDCSLFAATGTPRGSGFNA